MIICPVCHEYNPDGSIFCKKCGAALAAAPAAGSTAAPAGGDSRQGKTAGKEFSENAFTKLFRRVASSRDMLFTAIGVSVCAVIAAVFFSVISLSSAIIVARWLLIRGFTVRISASLFIPAVFVFELIAVWMMYRTGKKKEGTPLSGPAPLFLQIVCALLGAVCAVGALGAMFSGISLALLVSGSIAVSLFALLIMMTAAVALAALAVFLFNCVGVFETVSDIYSGKLPPRARQLSLLRQFGNISAVCFAVLFVLTAVFGITGAYSELTFAVSFSFLSVPFCALIVLMSAATAFTVFYAARCSSAFADSLGDASAAFAAENAEKACAEESAAKAAAAEKQDTDGAPQAAGAASAGSASADDTSAGSASADAAPVMPKFCPYCGTKFGGDGEKFCPECGAKRGK